MLQIHNSLTGTRQQFRPPHAPHVGLYVCGVTVYDYCHVGHARCYVVFDVVRRWLRQRGYQVAYVRNITDIDDKIIRRAAEAGMSIGELAARYTAAMREDFAALGIEPPDHEPLATAHIPGIIAMIGQLVERGYAYVGGDGDVFYAVGRFAGYGQLSGKRLADLRAGARVATDEAKRDPLDFVLWKRAKPQEPAWESPWGPGRPGWHIECSAMSTALLGTHFDIHGGGMDLKFPHHENEIAQSCGAHDGPFVDVWMHNGFVTVDDEKMSKSLGNFFTIRDVLQRLRHPEVLRTFLLSSHYRGPINYSQVQLEQADAALCRLYTALRGVTPAAQFSPGEHSARFAAALDDDFNTPEALAALQGLARALNAARARAGGHAPGAAVEPAPAGSAADAGAAALAAELRALGAHLGLLGQDAEGWFHRAAQIHAGAAGCDEALGTSAALNEARIEALIEARLVARKARNFAAADRIRGELAAAGVVLEDQPGGRTTWRRD